MSYANINTFYFLFSRSHQISTANCTQSVGHVVVFRCLEDCFGDMNLFSSEESLSEWNLSNHLARKISSHLLNLASHVQPLFIDLPQNLLFLSYIIMCLFSTLNKRSIQ